MGRNIIHNYARWIRDTRIVNSEIKRRDGKTTITLAELGKLLLLLVVGAVLISALVSGMLRTGDTSSRTAVPTTAGMAETAAAKNGVSLRSTGAPAALPATAVPTAIPTATVNPRLLIRYEEGGQCLIKGNINSKGEKIYHLPGSSSYAATKIETSKGERWFCTEAEAIAAGWHAPAQ